MNAQSTPLNRLLAQAAIMCLAVAPAFAAEVSISNIPLSSASPAS